MPCRLTSASRAMAAGALSEDETAQQRGQLRGSRALPVRPLRRNLGLDYGRELKSRDGDRPDPAGTAFRLVGQSPQHAIRSYGDLIDPDAKRVVDRVGHGRDDGKQRPLSRLLGTKRTLGIIGLDQVRMHLGGLERGRTLVLEHRGKLVQPEPEGLLLHQSLAQGHVDATFHLAFYQYRVDGAADVMRDPDLRNPHLAGPRLAIDFDHGRGVRVGRTRSNTGALVGTGKAGRRVAAAGTYYSVLRLEQLHRLREIDPFLGVSPFLDAPVAHDQVIAVATQCARGSREQPRPDFLGGRLGGVARDEGHPRWVPAQVDRGEG